jgi:hypothetical protein
MDSSINGFIRRYSKKLWKWREGVSNKEDLFRFVFKVLSFDVGTENKSEHFFITFLRYRVNSHNYTITERDL